MPPRWLSSSRAAAAPTASSRCRPTHPPYHAARSDHPTSSLPSNVGTHSCSSQSTDIRVLRAAGRWLYIPACSHGLGRQWLGGATATLGLRTSRSDACRAASSSPVQSAAIIGRWSEQGYE